MPRGSVVDMKTGKKKKQKIVSHSFRELKNIINRKREMQTAESPVPVNVEAKPITDKEIFLEAMKGVEEISEFRNIPLRLKRNAHKVRRVVPDLPDRKARGDLEKIVKGKTGINLPDTQEFVKWVNSDYGKDIVERLHMGYYSVQDSLDIHGLIVDEAEIEVERFIRESVRRGFHCVKIITGRGLRSPKGPVLKSAVIQWLTRKLRKYVVAFVTARPCDGGLGALYVLLRI